MYFANRSNAEFIIVHNLKKMKFMKIGVNKKGLLNWFGTILALSRDLELGLFTTILLKCVQFGPHTHSTHTALDPE